MNFYGTVKYSIISLSLAWLTPCGGTNKTTNYVTSRMP